MTARPLREVETEVVQRLVAAANLFAFLDYDGTLSPLAPTPDAAAPLAGTAAVLQALAALPLTQVALVSGRTVADLERFLDVPGIYYVGIHGLELRVPNGTVELSDSVAVVRSVLPTIKRKLEQALDQRPGVLIEDKGLALACHYRLASRADATAARETVMATARDYRRQGLPITVMHGHEVVEIRPASVNKGKTVCRLLAAQSPPALALYIGDDHTDEDAFRLLPAESVTIRVGPATVPTAARYRVADPEEVQRFLGAIVRRRGGRREVATARGLGD
jgi:trehalose 6-phosphate phosphatase